MRNLIQLLILLFSLHLHAQDELEQSASSWSQLLKDGEGKAIFYWYFQNLHYAKSTDIIDRVEHELATSFITYLENTYNVSIESEWKPDTIIQYVVDKERIVLKYLGDDMLKLIDRISKSAEIGSYEEIILLAWEKKLQYKELLDAANKAQEEQRVRNLLIGGVVVVLLALLLYMRYHLKSKTNLALAEKQLLIETRNQQLLGLNAEKNNLIKILVHDLRTPIAQIIGFLDWSKRVIS